MELFRLIGKIAIDGMPEAESAMGKVGSVATKMGQVVAAGVAAASTAIVGVAKAAVDSYADYEQLVGGVETLFKDSAGKVQEYAQNAYKTAGLSANEYMETVTSFSASLLQSLGGNTQQAAEMADMAITDMADNANKMGTDMSAIQNAYQGFAKQNYTMLDNLKLGYGGTATEMARLINDSGVLGDAMIDLGDKQNIGAALAEVGFGKMVEAIHVVQTEMGITGTTAKEAASTIQGSVSAMKSAWNNLLTGMADDKQNLEELFDQFVNSIVAVADNLIPRIQKLLPRIATATSELVKQLASKIPPMIETLLPSVLTGAINIVAELIKNFPSLVRSIVTALVNTIKSYGSTMKDTGAETLQNLTTGIETKLPEVIAKAAEIMTELVTGLSKYLPDIISVAGKIIVALATGLINSLPSLVSKLPTIISSIVKGLAAGTAEMATVGLNLVKGLWNGIGNAKDWLVSKVKGFGQNILDNLKEAFDIHSPSHATEEQGKMLALGLAEGINKNKKYAEKSSKEMADIILEAAEKRYDWQTTFNHMSTEAEIGYWREIYNSCEKGTAGRLQAYKNYLAAKQKLAEEEKAAEDKIVSDAEKRLDIMQTYNEVSTENEVAYWEGILAQLKKGSDAHLAAYKKYKDAKERLAEEEAAAEEEILRKRQEAQDKWVENASKYLDICQTYNEVSTAEEVNFWKTILDRTETGTEAHLEVYKKYKDAKERLADEEAAAAEEAARQLKEAQDKVVTDAEDHLKQLKRNREVSAAEEVLYWQQIVDATQAGTDARIAAEDKYYSALDSYKQQYDSYVKGIMNQMGLFEEFLVGEDVQGSTLIANLESQVDALEDYYDILGNLETRIGGTALMEELEEMGVDSLAELQAINNMTDYELTVYAALYDEKFKLAKDKATEKLGDISEIVKTETETSSKKTDEELGNMVKFFDTYTGRMLSTTAEKFEAIQKAISDKMCAAVVVVEQAVEDMNEALADAPTGGMVDVDAGNLEAHAAGGILTKPTIFGYTPSTNTYHLGGEAGAEAIAPIDVLQGYVRAAVADGMKATGTDRVTGLLEKMVELLQISAASDTKLEINGREFGRMVKEYA